MRVYCPDEATLHAWVDGELSADEAAQVAQWLAEHPEQAARMAAVQAQNAGLRALHAHVLQEPAPSHLRQALRQPRASWSWSHALAATVILSVGIALGYGFGTSQMVSHQSRQTSPLPIFVREAAAAHAVYAPEQRHPVEVAVQQQAHLVQWLSRRLGVALKVPSLDAEGFHLMGGRLLPGEAGQARAQFMYENSNGQRATLYMSVLSRRDSKVSTAPSAFQWTEDGSTQGFYWIEEDQGYALSAAMPRAQLQVLAEAIYRQLN